MIIKDKVLEKIALPEDRLKIFLSYDADIFEDGCISCDNLRRVKGEHGDGLHDGSKLAYRYRAAECEGCHATCPRVDFECDRRREIIKKDFDSMLHECSQSSLSDAIQGEYFGLASELFEMSEL